MSFAFRPSDTDLARAVRRLTGKRAAHALAALGSGAAPTEALHEARKDAKKLRALLKLVGPVFPGYSAENRVLRDAARAVSPLRDRGAMLEAFDRVAPGARAQDFASVRDALEARAPPTADEAALVAEFAATFAALKTRATHWKLEKKGFDAVEEGLRCRYARSRAAMAAARATGTPEAFHDWRKAAKTHWFHAGLLAASAPDLMAPHVALAEDVAERLGDHHDLVTLAALLPDLDIRRRERAAFADRVTAQARALERHAFAQGALLHADRPGALARRWRIWWELSRV